ncbi:MAG: cupin domain-containing protein [Terrimesophilobacter sp.]
MTKLIRTADAPVVEEPDNNLAMRALVSGADSGGDVSVTWVQLAGRHRRLRTARSTRTYAVLAGTVEVQVGDDPPQVVEAGQLVVVPRGVPYELSGFGTYLVVNAPAFMSGDDSYLD